MRDFTFGKGSKLVQALLLAAAIGSAGNVIAAAPAKPAQAQGAQGQKPAQGGTQGGAQANGQNGNAAQGGAQGGQPCGPGGMPGPGPEGFGLLPRGPLPDDTQLAKGVEHMLKHLVPDASDAQKTAITNLAKAEAADLKTLQAQGKTLAEAREAILLAATVDRTALEQNRVAQQTLIGNISKRVDQADADFTSLLSAAQRAKAADIIKQDKARMPQGNPNAQGSNAQGVSANAQGAQGGANLQCGPAAGQGGQAGTGQNGQGNAQTNGQSVLASPFGRK